jgi:septum site-determining protein MinD
VGDAIVITSGKGGVGKTTTTANIGTSLALLGKKVVLVDTDIGLRNLDVVLGLDNRVIFDLVDVCHGRCKVNQALIKDKRFEGLSLLPAAQLADKSAVNTTQMKELIEELKKDHDFVLIDCPAGIEQGFKNAVVGANKAIVVTTPDPSAVRDADRVIGLLEQEGHIDPPRLIINRIRTQMLSKGDTLEIDEITNILSIELLGIVADDDEVIKAAKDREPIALNPKNRVSIAYRNIARRLLGESIPLQNLTEDVGVFAKVKKFFGIR